MSLVYEPAEDSYLLESVIKKYAKNRNVLDMCSGSGILVEKAKSSAAKSVLAVDVNPASINILKSKKIPAIKSDLFSKLPISRKFDLIVCNPPYLPEDEKEDNESKIATTGGVKGDEFIIKFITQAQKYLKKSGIILILVSSLTPKSKIITTLKKLNFQKRTIASKKIFFETLEVWEIKHNNA